MMHWIVMSASQPPPAAMLPGYGYSHGVRLKPEAGGLDEGHKAEAWVGGEGTADVARLRLP